MVSLLIEMQLFLLAQGAENLKALFPSSVLTLGTPKLQNVHKMKIMTSKIPFLKRRQEIRHYAQNAVCGLNSLQSWGLTIGSKRRQFVMNLNTCHKCCTACTDCEQKHSYTTCFHRNERLSLENSVQGYLCVIVNNNGPPICNLRYLRQNLHSGQSEFCLGNNSQTTQVLFCFVFFRKNQLMKGVKCCDQSC